MTDATVLARAVAGDRDAYAELVTEYYASCLRVATRMLRNAADAEDAVQETFLRALRALPRFRPEVPFRAWLFRILLNQCATQGRRRSRDERRRAGDAALLERLPGGPGPRVDDLDRITAAVDALDPLLREAFVLKYIEELDYREMAVATGASVSALKMRAKRACDALRPQMEAIFR
jgi:RNA polymerase sigma-70 factor, ECF subfamily